METIAKIKAELTPVDDTTQGADIAVDGSPRGRFILMLYLVRLFAEESSMTPKQYLVRMLRRIDDAEKAEKERIVIDRGTIENAKGGAT